MAAGTSDPQTERPGVPSRNPLPLSASQEAQVREIFYARVRGQCADEIKGVTCHLSRRTRYQIAYANISGIS